MSLNAGAATVDFELPPGALIAAFPRGPNREPRRSKGSLDPVRARALALANGDEQVLLASVDLCLVRQESMQRIRQMVCRRLPHIRPEHVLVAATHTHAGPETSFLFGAKPGDSEVTGIESLVADALVQAHQDLEPVTMAWDRSTLPINHNRRVLNDKGRSEMALQYDPERTTGPVDPDVLALRFTRSDGRVKAIVFHYTAHALTLGPDNDYHSADYPGEACRVLEEALPGATALFLNGAAGNVHPRQCMRATPEARDSVGQALGGMALELVRRAEPVTSNALALRSARLSFPNRADPALSTSAEITVLQIGPILLGFVPGEFFVEFQLQFKEAIAPHPGTMVGYANGWPGYVPTREAYAEGGYGVDIATQDPTRYSRTALPPGAGEALLDRLTALALERG